MDVCPIRIMVSFTHAKPSIVLMKSSVKQAVTTDACIKNINIK